MTPEPESRKVVVELDRCACGDCERTEAELSRICARFDAALRVRRVEEELWLKDLAGWKTPLVYVDGRLVSQVSITPKKWEAAIRGKAEQALFEIGGEVIDLECHLRDEKRGETHEECARDCIERGMPIGLLTPQEQVYLLIAEPELRQAIANAAGKELIVRGHVFRKGGVQVVVVREVL